MFNPYKMATEEERLRASREMLQGELRLNVSFSSSIIHYSQCSAQLAAFQKAISGFLGETQILSSLSF